MKDPELIIDLTLWTLYSSFEISGEIDNLKNLEGSKVYLFSGTEDSVIYPGVVRHAENLYRHFGADLKTEYSIKAEHAMISDKYG